MYIHRFIFILIFDIYKYINIESMTNEIINSNTIDIIDRQLIYTFVLR